MRRVVMIGVAAAVVFGCGNDAAPESIDPENTHIEGQIHMDKAMSDADVAAAALAIAAEYLGVPEGELEIVSVQAVNWPDSSLGCPQPGRSYLQVITPGYRALVRHADREVPVHMSGRSGTGLVCESAKAIEEPADRRS